MEDKLYSESFLQLREDGRKVKRWLFNTGAKQLMAHLYPNVNDFTHSDQWLKGFRNRKNVHMPHSMLPRAYVVLFLSSMPSCFVLQGMESLSLATLQIWIKHRYHLSSTTAKPTTTKARKRSGVPLLLPDLINANALSN